MKLLEPETTGFKEKMNLASKQGNIARTRELQKEMMSLREKHSINFFSVIMNLFQVPVLITWFVSLRYVLSIPELYPGILSRYHN